MQFQAGFILHHRVFRETSLIADVLTPDHGVVRLVARGARTARSKRRPLLQVFRPLLLSWSGRGEMKTLAGIEEQGMPIVLQGLQLACGYYLNELLLRLLRFNESNVIVFAHYAGTLNKLAEARNQLETEACLRAFELELLESQGLVPDFSHCVLTHSGGANAQTTDEPMVDRQYRYFPETGQAIAIADEPDSGLSVQAAAETAGLPAGVAEAPGGVKNYPTLSDGTVATRTLVVSGETLLSLAARDFSNPQCRAEVKRLMRTQLALHLGTEPLKSREMIGFYNQPASRQTSSSDSTRQDKHNG